MAATRKSTASKSTAKSTAKKTTATPVKKSDVPEHLRDYTYLAEKAPTALHEDFSQWMLEVTGYEPEDVDAFLKGVQLAAVLRGVYQRSPRNKSRSEYRALDEAVVAQRSVHMIQAHKDAGEIISKRPVPKAQARKASAAKAPAKRRTAKKASASK